METNENCNKCGKITKWVGTEKRMTCQGCKCVFPCAHQCKHVDCKLKKGQLKACDCGMILGLDETCKCKNSAKSGEQ